MNWKERLTEKIHDGFSLIELLWLREWHRGKITKEQCDAYVTPHGDGVNVQFVAKGEVK